MSVVEGEPPQLHNRHLSTSQQAYCEQNPTYLSRLASLRRLRTEVGHAQSMLGIGQHYTGASRDKVARWKQELQELEERFMAWDDELATLAEALLGKPKFRIDDKLQLADGRWQWSVPAGSLALPKHSAPPPKAAFVKRTGPTPTRTLSRRVSNRLSKLLPKRGDSVKRLKARSVELF